MDGTFDPGEFLPSVFLSYARRDDEPFVKRLYTDLRDRGFTVWWDREKMPSRSLSFTEEIRDAIHRHDRMVLVLGPAAAQSEYVQAEWQAALAARKPVVPVLRRVPDEEDAFGEWLPPELRRLNLHVPDLRVSEGLEPSLDLLARILAEPVPRPVPVHGDPPELPPHFRPRPEPFARLSEAVLGETTGPRVKTGQARVTVLVGMGGIGKTVLAAAMVEALRSRPSTFLADGVFWISGGLMRRLAALCAGVPTDVLDDRTLEDAVREHLEGRRFLLVVDDVTSPKQLAPLVRVLGPGGRMLVTTRNGELAVGHDRVDLDDLGEHDAIALVADWLAVAVEAVPLEARRMIELCGSHPFAVAVNAAAVSQGLSWSSILTALEHDELDLAELQGEEYLYSTVEASLSVSVEALPPEEQDRYRELAGFIWDHGVPVSAVRRLWRHRGLAAHRADRLLVRLRQRSLLRLHGGRAAPEVRLHDLHRAFLQTDEQHRLSQGEALLGSYRPDPPRGWWDVPDDGYLRPHLVRHLAAAGRPGELSELLLAEDEHGRNRWYQARQEVPVGGDDRFTGYVADIEVAEDHLPRSLPPLITSSLRSLSRVVPSGLLAAAVRDGHRSVTDGMTAARLVAEPAKRASAMTALLPVVPDRVTWLDEVLDALEATEVTDREPVVRALAEAVDPEEALVVLRRIVSWVEQASSAFVRGRSTPLVHPVLDRCTTETALDAARLVEDAGITSLRLHRRLPPSERSARLRELLDRDRARTDNLGPALLAGHIDAAIEDLDPADVSALVDEALVGLRTLGGPGGDAVRTRGLLDLLPHLTGATQDEVLHELSTSASADPQLWRRLVAVAPVARQSLLRGRIEREGPLWVAAAAAPAFTGEHRRAVVEQVLTRIETTSHAESLLLMDGADLLLAMDEDQLARARELIDRRLTGEQRVRGLLGVARATSAERRPGVVDDVLAAALALHETDDRERALAEVASLLAPRQVAAALAGAQRIGEPSGWQYLPSFLPLVSSEVRVRLLDELLDWARDQPFPVWARALEVLPTGLRASEADAWLELIQDVPDVDGRRYGLTVLASRIEDHAVVEDEAARAVEACTSPTTRFDRWLAMGAVDRAEQELLALAPMLAPDDFTASVAALVGRLPPGRREGWVAEALRHGERARHALRLLAPYLDVAQATTYLARQLAPEDDDGFERLLLAWADPHPTVVVEDEAATVAALARRLGDRGAAEAAWSLLEIGRSDEVTMAGLVALAPYLSTAQVLTVEARLRSARVDMFFVPDDIGRRGADREHLFARLAPSLARAGDTEHALVHARHGEERDAIPALLGIASALGEPGNVEVLLEAFALATALRDIWRRRSMSAVAHSVAESPAAAALVWSLAVEWVRNHPRAKGIELLASLAPVAAVVGGTDLVEEVLEAVERVLRWWP